MANTVTVNTLTKMNIPWHWWFWQKSHQATKTNYNMEDKSHFLNHIRKYFYYIIIVLKEIKSVLMMATERKKVVTDKFIHNLINISNEKQAKVQKVYFLESQYFIVPSQHHNISCMWLTASLDILIIENFTDLFKNIFCMIKTWWFFLPFSWLKENNKLSSSKSNLPWFI